MDRLRALEVFIAVADVGSLAGAARKLSLSAPSVTRILGEFEQSLGVQLFHRTTRAVTLTEPGQHFLDDARRIINDYQDASDGVRGLHREPAGLLRMTAPTLFGQHYVLPIIQQFMDQYPNVKVEGVFLDRVVNIVEEGFDLAVRIGPLADSNFIATNVGSVRRVVCAHPAYLEQHGEPETPKDLRDHRTISAAPLNTRNQWQFRGQASIKVSPELSLSSMPAVIESVRSGWGLAQVLSYQVGPYREAGELVTVLRDYEPEPLPIHLVHAEGRSASAKVRTFVEMARDLIRDNPQLRV